MKVTEVNAYRPLPPAQQASTQSKHGTQAEEKKAEGHGGEKARAEDDDAAENDVAQATPALSMSRSRLTKATMFMILT